VVMLLAAVGCSFGCIDAQLLQSMGCEHVPSGGVRREDAVQSAGSISHFPSVSCPWCKWLLLLAESIGLRICNGIVSSSLTVRLLLKRASACSHRCPRTADCGVRSQPFAMGWDGRCDRNQKPWASLVVRG